MHPDYCITSPVIDGSVAPGSLVCSDWRHLHADYPPYLSSHVDVSSDGGAHWAPLYAVLSGQNQNDVAWNQVSFDVTAQKSATMQFRFCHSVGSGGIFNGGGWNIDDVTLATSACP